MMKKESEKALKNKNENKNSKDVINEEKLNELLNKINEESKEENEDEYKNYDVENDVTIIEKCKGKIKEFFKLDKNKIVYLITLIISLLIIICGKTYYKDKLEKQFVDNGYTYGKVVEKISESEDKIDFFGNMQYLKVITFKSKLKNGSIVNGIQKIDNTYPILSPEIRVGDDVMLVRMEYDDEDENSGYYQFIDFDRKVSIYLLIFLFFIAVIAFGKSKGINTSIALVLTFLYIFEVYIPAVTLGSNAYLASALLCIYSIVSTLLLVAGLSSKTIAAMLGCFGGLTVASIITVLYMYLGKITGGGDEHSISLMLLNPDNHMNLKGIIFSSILIGSLGAVMDVGMSISSALAEIKEKATEISFKELFKSGIAIGRDIVGTMANTLFLAYVGSSLCAIILLMSYNTYSSLIEKEVIVVEILQAVAGTIGIIITIPITSFVSSVIFKNKERDDIRKNKIK